jgi:hypothetical protein
VEAVEQAQGSFHHEHGRGGIEDSSWDPPTYLRDLQFAQANGSTVDGRGGIEDSSWDPPTYLRDLQFAQANGSTVDDEDDE